MINDEGCRVNPFQGSINYSVLPIKTYWFKDGLYVCDAVKNYKNIIGEKLLFINGMNIDTLFQKMVNVLSGGNQYSKRYNFSLYTQIPAWLKFVGLNCGEGYAIIKTSSGKEYMVFYEPVGSYIKLNRQMSYRKLALNSNEHLNENYWMEYIKDKKTLFVQFLQIRNNKSGLSFKKFVNEIDSKLNNLEVEKTCD